MEKNVYNLVNEFGNYLLSVQNENNECEFLIYGSIINHPDKKTLVNMFRIEFDDENNQTREIELTDGTKKTINKCSNNRIFIWFYLLY